MCLVQLQAAVPGSVWGLISNNVEEEDYNYSAPAAGEDHHDNHVVSHYLLNVLSCVFGPAYQQQCGGGGLQLLC